jgi:hypothetical protein
LEIGFELNSARPSRWHRGPVDCGRKICIADPNPNPIMLDPNR